MVILQASSDSGCKWPECQTYLMLEFNLLSGVPDYFYRNKISSGGDLSHYSSASGGVSLCITFFSESDLNF